MKLEKYVPLAFFVIMIFAVMGLVYNKPKCGCKKKNSCKREHMPKTKEDPCFTFYYVDWCGHCKKAKPEFEKVSNESKSGAFGRIQVRKVNCEGSVKEIQEAEKMNIDGFPMFYYFPRGLNFPKDAQLYTGSRTFDGIHNFLKGKI